MKSKKISPKVGERLRPKMWLENLIFLATSFIVIQLANGHLLKRNANTVVFRRNSTVQINGVKFNELNCTFPIKSLCDNITEITCSTLHGKLVTNSCIVSGNENSFLFNRTVSNETVICAGKRLLKGECYLKFSPSRFVNDFALLKLNLVTNPDGTIRIHDDFFDRKSPFDGNDPFNPPFGRRDPFNPPFDKKDPFNPPFDRRDPFDNPFFKEHNERVEKAKREMDERSKKWHEDNSKLLKCNIATNKKSSNCVFHQTIREPVGYL